MNVKAEMQKIPTQLLYGKEGVIVGHIPCIISCVCTLFSGCGGAIQCTVTGPRKYSYDLLQGGLELPCTYRFTILLTLFTELMVDHDKLLGKELYPAGVTIWQQ